MFLVTANATEQAAIKTILKDGDFHAVSHYAVFDNPVGLMANAIVDEFYMKQFALLITKLKAANLIDRTLVYFNAGFGNSSYHSKNGLPCMTAGRAVGAKTNMLRVFQQYYEFDDNQKNYKAAVSRLMVDIMQAFGVQGVTINNFGLRKMESLNDAARQAAFGLF